MEKITSWKNIGRGSFSQSRDPQVLLKIGLRHTLRGDYRRQLFFSVLPPDRYTFTLYRYTFTLYRYTFTLYIGILSPYIGMTIGILSPL